MKASKSSFVKHTSAGEMPDARRFAELERRIEGIAPVLREQLQSKSFLIGLGLAVAALGGIFYILNREQGSSSS